MENISKVAEDPNSNYSFHSINRKLKFKVEMDHHETPPPKWLPALLQCDRTPMVRPQSPHQSASLKDRAVWFS